MSKWNMKFISAACDEWFYGLGCQTSCACVISNSESCDPKNGLCSCQAGWHGNECDDRKFLMRYALKGKT